MLPGEKESKVSGKELVEAWKFLIIHIVKNIEAWETLAKIRKKK